MLKCQDCGATLDVELGEDVYEDIIDDDGEVVGQDIKDPAPGWLITTIVRRRTKAELAKRKAHIRRQVDKHERNRSRKELRRISKNFPRKIAEQVIKCPKCIPPQS